MKLRYFLPIVIGVISLFISCSTSLKIKQNNDRRFYKLLVDKFEKKLKEDSFCKDSLLSYDVQVVHDYHNNIESIHEFIYSTKSYLDIMVSVDSQYLDAKSFLPPKYTQTETVVVHVYEFPSIQAVIYKIEAIYILQIIDLREEFITIDDHPIKTYVLDETCNYKETKDITQTQKRSLLEFATILK